MKKDLRKRRAERIRRFASKGLFESTHNNATIKWAETDQDFKQAYSLLYDRYLESNYIKASKSFPFHYNVYNLLPDTKTAILKKIGGVVSTVDIVMESEEYGMPLDQIYHSELDELWGQGRKLCEVGSLACSKEASWQNTFMPLFRVIFWRAVNTGSNDICIMVNPKHVAFYENIMIFERLGEEKFYPNVNAPAVALRMNLDQYENNVKQAYKGYAHQNSLYSYFYDWSLTSTRNECSMITSSHFVPMNDNLLDYFIANNESVSQNLAESDLFQ